MSGSVKRAPVCRDRSGTKSLQWSKRQANKKVRRTKEIANGKAYRKVYETWNIHDYVTWQSLGEYQAWCRKRLAYHLLQPGGRDELPKWFRREMEDTYFLRWRKSFLWK